MVENPYQSPVDRPQPRRPRYTGYLAGCLWLSAFWVWLFVLVGLGFVVWRLWPFIRWQ
jgi:hypothetical protein